MSPTIELGKFGSLPCFAAIAAMIGRRRSVMWRKEAGNRGPDGSYWTPVADRAAQEKRRRPKAPFKLRANPAPCRWIEEWMDDS